MMMMMSGLTRFTSTTRTSSSSSCLLLLPLLALLWSSSLSAVSAIAQPLPTPTTTPPLIGEDEEDSSSPFIIIIDGGSTGSRLHVFEFVETESPSDDSSSSLSSSLECHRRGSARTELPLSAFGRSHDDIAQGRPVNATALVEHVQPVLEYAAAVVPVQYHSKTRVLYQATAGMRLLPESEQEAIYQALFDGLLRQQQMDNSNSFDFVFAEALQRSDLQTLSGELEGYYGAIAANYLKGVVNAALEVQDEDDDDDNDDDASLTRSSSSTSATTATTNNGPIGALDMGGSSTQIVFLPQAAAAAIAAGSDMEAATLTSEAESDQQSCFAFYNDEDVNDNDEDVNGNNRSSDSNEGGAPTCQAASATKTETSVEGQQGRILQGEHFFATSYLSYGVDQFRERLWTTWVEEHKQQVAAAAASETSDEDDDDDSGYVCDAKVIANPCAFNGYELEWDGHTLIGTGDAAACTEQVRQLIPHPHGRHVIDDDEEENDNAADGQRVVGGIPHPPVHGKFFAMSLYFFTLDALRELAIQDKEAHEALNRSWPTPSIAELSAALQGLCGRSWQGDLEDIAHKPAHAFTRAQVLPHRCLESVYMVTLLRDGFGFAPESRDITFTFLVDGNEVEWTLGMALALKAEEEKSKRATTRPTTASTSNVVDKEEDSDEDAVMENNVTNKTYEEERAAPVCLSKEGEGSFSVWDEAPAPAATKVSS